MHVPKQNQCTRQNERKKKHVNLRWCYTRRCATPIFSAILCNIVATLVWMTAILFQQSSFAWPHVDLARPPRRKKFGVFGLYLSSLSKTAGFVSLAGKPSLVVYLMLSYSYDPSMFIYCWSSNRWKKLCWKGSMACLLPSLCIILYGVWIWANYPKNSFEH